MFRFVALHPDRDLWDRVSRQKGKVHAAVGPQAYLDHPPHSTVYLADFPDDVCLLDRLAPVLASQPSLRVRSVGWHEFLGDPLTGLNTLVYNLDDGTIASLRNLQTAIVGCLARLRRVASTTERYASRWASLTAEQQASVTACGFPYVGDGWRPHFTIASIRPGDWIAAKTALAGDEPVGDFSCSALAEYSLETATPKLVATAPFARADR